MPNSQSWKTQRISARENFQVFKVSLVSAYEKDETKIWISRPKKNILYTILHSPRHVIFCWVNKVTSQLKITTKYKINFIRIKTAPQTKKTLQSYNFDVLGFSTFFLWKT